MVRARLCTAILLVLAAPLGCGDGETSGLGQPHYSSAATIEVRPTHTAASRWTLADAPDLILGSVANSGPELFQAVDQVLLLADGGVAVVDRNPPRIEVFARSGAHVATLGAYGEGPGEFQTEPAITEVGRDTILAWDPSVGRLTWFRTSGELLDVETVRGGLLGRVPRVFIPDQWELTSHGDLAIALSSQAVFAGRDSVVGILGLDMLVTYADYPSPPRTSTPRLPNRAVYDYRSPFVGGALVAVGGNPPRVYVSDPNTWTIDVHRISGERIGRVRLDLPRIAVTRERLRAARDSLLGRSRFALRERTEAFDRLEHPDSSAAIGRLFWDEDGYLWVGHRPPFFNRAAREYEILDGDGTWLGWFILPDGISGYIQDIGYGRLAIERHDELGVTFVDIYQLHPPA